MKKFLLAIALSMACTFAMAALVRNLGTDPTPVGTDNVVSCNLYKAGVLVVNTAVVTAAGTNKCLFPSISLLSNESYTATYLNATGLESPQSGPFATGTAPTAPNAVKIVP